MKKLRIFLVSISILLVLFLAVGFFAGNYFYNMALVPGTNKSEVLDAPHNQMETSDEILERRKINKAWFEQSPKEDVYLQSKDNLKLHAYQIKQEEPYTKWAIVCHGYTGKASAMAGYAKRFYEQGFNVLLPDARGHGDSEGAYIGMGWPDRLDIVDWIDTIVKQDPNSQIALYGVSMGAATVMMVSGEELPPNVKVVVEDCGYTSAKEEFTYQLKQLYNIPAFPLIPFSSLVTKMRAGYFLGEANALSQIEKSITPTLFIHGDKDTFVPSYMLEELYAKGNMEKEKLLVEGAGHGMASTVAGEFYWTTVWNFVDKYIQ